MESKLPEERLIKIEKEQSTIRKLLNAHFIMHTNKRKVRQEILYTYVIDNPGRTTTDIMKHFKANDLATIYIKLKRLEYHGMIDGIKEKSSMARWGNPVRWYPVEM